MLLKNYKLEIFNSECNPSAMTVHCFAHLDIEILKLLPKTNCRECGDPTCMVFAARVAEGVKGAEDCPPLTDGNREKLFDYMKPFDFDV